MCHNFLVIMKKAVCILGSIALQDKKIKSNNCQFLYVLRLINILVLFLLQHLNWIERCSTIKNGRFFFFCLSIIIEYTCRSSKTSIPSLKNIVVINDLDLHIFQIKIDIVIFGRFLHFKFSQQPRYGFAY